MDDLSSSVIDIVETQLNQTNVNLGSTLRSLGCDQLDFVEIIMELEDRFGVEIPETDADKMVRVSELVDYIRYKQGLGNDRPRFLDRTPRLSELPKSIGGCGQLAIPAVKHVTIAYLTTGVICGAMGVAVPGATAAAFGVPWVVIGLICAVAVIGLVWIAEVYQSTAYKLCSSLDSYFKGQRMPKQVFTFNGNTNIGTLVGEKVTGAITSNLQVIHDSGNASLAESLEKLVQSITSATILSDQDKKKAVEQVGAITEQAALPKEKRNTTVVEVLVSSLSQLLSTAGSVASAWSSTIPLIKTVFGL